MTPDPLFLSPSTECCQAARVCHDKTVRVWICSQWRMALTPRSGIVIRNTAHSDGGDGAWLVKSTGVPLNYMLRHADSVSPNSGGVTEETMVLGVPSLTLRDKWKFSHHEVGEAPERDALFSGWSLISTKSRFGNP